MATKRSARRSYFAGVPDWSKDAIWYQIFPERFRNGSRRSDPAIEDIADQPVPGWKVSDWGKDWYALDGWEKPFGSFLKSVYFRRFGGDLAGIREKLDYLQDLGVNAIYLNPIFLAPSLHKYDAACLHHVDPTLGPDRDGDLDLLARAGETEDPGTWIWTAADRYFIDLVREIHRRGMRVIIDGVFNHVGTRFFAFRDVVRNRHASRYVDWFRINGWNADGSFEYQGWFGHRGLPELGRTKDDLAPPVKDYLFAVTRRWMDPNGDGDPADGVDGWRLDVAFCVPHGFWRKWRRLVKKINPSAFLTAEIVNIATDYLRGDEFDSVMNYAWLFPSVRFFAPSEAPAGVRTLKRALNVIRREYSADVQLVVQNLLDSHDIGRIATVLENRLPLTGDWDSYFKLTCAGTNPLLNAARPRRKTYDVLRQLVIFQMTYPGAPMIYYGTEVGMWGANDPDNRQPMVWGDIEHEDERLGPRGPCRASPRKPDRRLYSFFRRAIALRRDEKILRRGRFRWLETNSDRLLGFTRYDDTREIIALFNASDEVLSYRLLRSGDELWLGQRVGRGRIDVAPRGWRIVAVRRRA